ncbi:Pentatricopeptide repeat-containing protein [Smittium mucronatum]|uniref:Pentatricopeptide repeat-containing protein n=1 Tax=Smittium mucronatum TaxID=133383 RepID=A0A1R0H348_9FUNG|nr:Pentatricopeptide repeat-containing protein [Smittium mucronatum]
MKSIHPLTKNDKNFSIRFQYIYNSILNNTSYPKTKLFLLNFSDKNIYFRENKKNNPRKFPSSIPYPLHLIPLHIFPDSVQSFFFLKTPNVRFHSTKTCTPSTSLSGTIQISPKTFPPAHSIFSKKNPNHSFNSLKSPEILKNYSTDNVFHINHTLPHDSKPIKDLLPTITQLSKSSIDRLNNFSKLVKVLKNGQDSTPAFEMYTSLKELDLSKYLSIRIVQKLLTRLKNDGAPVYRYFKKTLPFDRDSSSKKTKIAIDRILQVIEDRRKHGFVPKEPEYEDLLEAISQDSSKESEAEVMNLIEVLLERARNRENDYFFLSDRSFYKIIKGFVFRGHARGAFWCYNRMIRESEALISLSCKKGIASNVSHEFEMAGLKIKPSYFTIGLLSNFLVDKNTIGPLLKMWANIVLLNEPIPTSLQRGIVSVFIKRNKIDEALWILRVGRYLGLTSQTKNTLSDSLPSRKDRNYNAPKDPLYEKAWDSNIELALIIEAIGNSDFNSISDGNESNSESFLHAESLANNLFQKYPPDLNVYSKLIEACISNGRYDLAESLFYELTELGMAPSNQTFAYMVSMYSDKEKIGKIKAILRHIFFPNYYSNRSFSKFDTDDYQPQINDFQFFVPLLYYYVSTNQLNEATQILSSLKSQHNNSISGEKLGAALIQIYRALGKPEVGILSAEKLVSKSEDSKVNPETNIQTSIKDAINSMVHSSDSSKSFYYSQKFSVYIEEKDLYMLVEVLKEMMNNKVFLTEKLINQLLYGFLECDSLDMFETLVNYYFENFNDKLSPSLYTRWIQELSRRGDAKGAYGVLMQMVDKGLIVSEIHYCMVIQACSLRGWTNQAKDLVDEMRHPDSPVRPGMSTKISLIEALVSAGDVTSSQAILDNLIYKSLIPRNKIPARAFNNLIIGYLYKGDGASAMKSYESMLRLGIKPNRFTYTAMMNAYAQERKIKNCSRILDQMIANNVEPDAAVFSILIAVYGVMSDIQAVENVFNQIENQNMNYINAKLDGQSVGLTRVMYPSKATLEPYHRSLGVADGTLEKYTKIDSRIIPTDVSRTRSRLIDPVIIVMMIKAYVKVKNMDKALMFWDRLIESYPIIKLNPRKLNGPRQAITSDFHVAAMKTVIRGFLRLIDLENFFGRPKMISDVSQPLPVDESIINSETVVEKNDTDFQKLRSSDFHRSDNYDLLAEKPDDFDSTRGEHFRADLRSNIQPHSSLLGGDDNIKNEISAEIEEKVLFKKKPKGVNTEKIEESQRDISNKLIVFFNKARENNFCFELVHVNEFISCLLLSSQYTELINTLKRCKPTQTEPLDSEYSSSNYGIRSEMGYKELPRLRINEQNVIYLIGRLKLAEDMRISTEEEIIGREQELVIRHKHLMSQPKWAKPTITNMKSNSDDSEEQNRELKSEARTFEEGAQIIPVLSDFLEKDIIMVELKKKAKTLTQDRDQLLRITKLFSNFVSNETVQSISETLGQDL